MRIVQLNLAADPALSDPEDLLDSYHTLTGWSDALTLAGATVHVVQRFSTDATLTRAGVAYEFVAEGRPGTPSPWTVFPNVGRAVIRARPDVIHVNGLMFPGMVRALRRDADPRVVLVLQDHSGALPSRAPRPLGLARSLRWRRALRHADACTFTAGELVGRWRAVGLPLDMRVLEIPEASTALPPMSRHEAQMKTGMHGAPAVLWVGRLDRNKDPLTILAGLERALPALAEAHVWMIAPPGNLRDDIQRRIDASSTLRRRVSMIGPIAHHDMAAYYSAADIFISGSRHEGSGYALIESMACGVVPCVTAIPSFRALTGGCGELWPVGDAAGFARALGELAARDLHVERVRVCRRFDRALSWRAIGQQTVELYGRLVEARRVDP